MPLGIYDRTKSKKRPPQSEEAKRKIGLANAILRKGTKASEKTKKKMSETHKRIGTGGWNIGKTKEKSHNWKGGKSFVKGYHSFYGQRYKARKRGASGFFSQGQWKNLKAQYNWTCPDCKRIEPNIKLEADHIIPLVKGGSDNIENIQPLCRNCNAKKGSKMVEKYNITN